MNNSHNDNQDNLISFLQRNQPIPPSAYPDLEQKIIDSLEPRSFRHRKYCKTLTWTIPSAIATGFLFTTVSMGVRTPRIAIEPKDLENFLVNNWQDTFNTHSTTFVEDSEADWLLPAVSESKQTVSVSSK
ncbi:MAG: hypothetical protein ACFCAD_27685 [Pleurocapsa sp.]